MKPAKALSMATIIGFAKNADKKTWMVLAAATVGVILLWFGLIGPAWVERPVLRREIQDMTKLMIQVNALNEKRPILERNQKVYADIIANARGRLFTNEGIGMLLGQVSKLADDSHVEVLASRPQEGNVIYAVPYDERYSASGYEFTVQGRYHDLGKLAGRIESYDKLLRIQLFRISSSEKNPERQRTELKVLAITAAPPRPPAATKSKKSAKASNAKKK